MLRRLIYLSSYFVLACAVVFIARPTYLYSICIVLVPPSLVNFFWLKRSKQKIFIFSLAAALLFAPPIELMMRLVNAWDVQSILARPLGLIPLENMLFAFLNFLWVLSFYECFVDKDGKTGVSAKFRYSVAIFGAIFVAVFGLYFYDRNMLSISYAAMSMPVLVIPAMLIFWKNPHLLRKTLLPTVYFAAVFFIYEVVSLVIGSWWWPGSYLYSFMVFGKVLPLDDVIIWYFLSTVTLIGGYEFFVDDYA